MAKDAVTRDGYDVSQTAAGKAEANQLFKHGQYDAAIAKYHQALAALPDPSPAVLLQNMAQAHLQLQQPEQALTCAAAAMQLSADHAALPVKACVRAAKAAHACGHGAAARWALSHVAKSDWDAQLRHVAGKLSQEAAESSLGDASAFLLAALQSSLKSALALQAQLAAASGSQSGSADSAALKLAGNAAFTASKPAQAIQLWQQALRAMPFAPVLLCNIAAAKVKLSKAELACACADAALLWGDSNIKALHRRAKAAADAGWLSEALACCEHALQHAPHDAAVQELKDTLQRQRRQANMTSAGPVVLGELEQRQAERPNAIRADALPAFEHMIQMMQTKHRERYRRLEREYGPKPSDFATRFVCSQLPAGCDAAACHKKLQSGYVDAMSIWVTELGAVIAQDTVGIEGWADAHDPVAGGATPRQIFARVRNKTERLPWWGNAPIGAVDFGLHKVYHSLAEVLTCFSNVEQHAYPIPPGGQHCAVGFGDLGELAETLLAWQEQPSHEGCTLKWDGFDSSAHACARVPVLVQMMKDRARVECVAQVRGSNALCFCTFSGTRLFTGPPIDSKDAVRSSFQL